MADIPFGSIAKTHKGGPEALDSIVNRVKKFNFTGYIRVLHPGEEDTEGFLFFNEGSVDLYLHRKTDESQETSGQQAMKLIFNDASLLETTIEIHTGVDIPTIIKSMNKAPAAASRRSSRRAVLAWGKSPPDASGSETSTHVDEPAVHQQEEEKAEPTAEKEAQTAPVQEQPASPPAPVETTPPPIQPKPMEERKPIPTPPLGVKPPSKKAVPVQEHHLIAKLHSSYRFDNFVVGNSNHFAHAAAVAVAEDPATTYNPLFIWSKPGLGKTHLLNGIANHIMEQHPHMKISYFTTEQFIRDLVESMKGGKLDAFRHKYRKADILIVDDVQFLADSDRSQEEFFHTFNSLYTVDKQIVLASDRPPKEIPTLKQRLVSRFEGGLIVEIQQPDYETRLAILKQKAADKNFEVDEDALALVARAITSNIRELEGALNKVSAFASFSKKRADIKLAKEVLKDLVKEEPPAEEKEETKEKPAPPPTEKKHEVKIGVDLMKEELHPGHSYLVEEPTLKDSVELFKKELSKDEQRDGMAVIRTNPTRIEREHKVKHLAEIYWLTDRESKKNKTIEPSLEKLMWELSEFLEDHSGGIILLDGLDYLTSVNGFESVTQFIRRIVDTVAETDGIIMVSLSPDTMEKKHVKILEREMDVLTTF